MNLNGLENLILLLGYIFAGIQPTWINLPVLLIRNQRPFISKIQNSEIGFVSFF